MENQSDHQEHERIAKLAAMCVCSNLRRASRAVTNYYDSLLGPVSSLRTSQAIVLVVVYLAGPQTINELAANLALDRTTLGRNLRPLEQQSLLTLIPGIDHRTRVVTLTPQGEASILHILPQWEQAQTDMVARLGQEQLTPFLAQLSNVATPAHDE
jgi:DNA-binding MarR family transcriptional regulator